MRGPDRKGVRGLANMTDSHMVGGPVDTSSGSGTLQQAAYFLGILLASAMLFVVSAFLGSGDAKLIWAGGGLIAFTILAVGLAILMRRRRRQSLDDVLRSRREGDIHGNPRNE